MSIHETLGDRAAEQKNAILQAASLIISNNLSTLVGPSLNNGVQSQIKIAKAVADLSYHIKQEMKNR